MSCLVILAAGLGSRFGGAKQLVEFGPLKRTLMEYNICHAYDAGFRTVVLVIQAQSKALVENQIVPRLPAEMKVHIAEQNNQQLPNTAVSPILFNNPLGTAHALWCARSFIKSDFSVINGDDYYSAEAFRLLASSENANHAAIVAFRLDRTLSEYGGVNRGICDSQFQSPNSHVHLTRVRECIDIKRTGKTITGLFKSTSTLIENNQRLELNDNDLVSMNCWRFKLHFMLLLEGALEQHFKEPNFQTECFLPDVVMQSIDRDSEIYRVEQSSEGWFGLTYRDDQKLVENEISDLTYRGFFNTLDAAGD